jgi:ATP-dependent DNA helicase RecG
LVKTAALYSASIPELISTGLGQELHYVPEDVPVSQLASVLFGMANTSGGIVLVGVSTHSGKILGVGNVDAAQDLIFQAALSGDPPLVLPLPAVFLVGRAKVVKIVVPPGLSQVYCLEGRYLHRVGLQTNPIPARRLRQLLVERGAVPMDVQIPPLASLDDLDQGKVLDYLELIKLSGSESWETALLQRGCLSQKGVTASQTLSLLPTYAGLLLFGRHPQRWLPNATILAARFSGRSFSDQFVKQEITGTLPEQIIKAEQFVRDNVRSLVRLVGLTSQETLAYPYEAVRELLVNAISHRDYNIQGDNIHLNIFSDRLEIHSPGGLPGPVNLENILHARYSRNVVIVQILSDLGFMERLGYGLDRVVAVLRQSGMRPPRFEEVAGTFRVTLHEDTPPADAVRPDISIYRDQDLNYRQHSALNFLAARKRITNRDYQELCPEVHAETLRRDLADLVSRGILIKIGDKRATYYILKRV